MDTKDMLDYHAHFVRPKKLAEEKETTGTLSSEEFAEIFGTDDREDFEEANFSEEDLGEAFDDESYGFEMDFGDE